jgi:Sec-independent protein secretion pathway component TatC
VIIAVLAAVITPTADPVNMAIFMLPLFGYIY